MKSKLGVNLPVALKKWTANEMNLSENWNFKFVEVLSHAHKRFAWKWEMERELESRNPAFSSVLNQLTTCTGETSIKELEDIDSLNNFPKAKLVRLGEAVAKAQKGVCSENELHALGQIHCAGGSPYRMLHGIEIDYRASKTRILEDFKKELDEWWDHISPMEKPKVGNKEAFSAWFKELAIYRFGRAGVLKRNGLPLLGSGIQMSSQNWQHAQTRTEKRILIHVNELRVLARNLSREKPCGWLELFVKLPDARCNQSVSDS